MHGFVCQLFKISEKYINFVINNQFSSIRRNLSLIKIRDYKEMKTVINYRKQLCFLMLLYLTLLSIEVKAQIPSVTLKTLYGKEIRTDSIRNQGNPMILTFFATWCKPCLRELEAIHELYEEWQAATGVKLIAISIDEAHNINKVKPLVDEQGWNFDILLDTQRELMRALGARVVPFSIIVDGSGKIVDRHNGYTDGYEHAMIEKIRKIAKP